MLECRPRLSGINPWHEKKNEGHGSPDLILFRAGSVWRRRTAEIDWLRPGDGGFSPREGSEYGRQVNEIHASRSRIAYHRRWWIVGSLVVRLVGSVKPVGGGQFWLGWVRLGGGRGVSERQEKH